jgi:hypothetical protein
MFLATEALGLGGWKHCGFLSFEIFARMGFRIVAAEGGSGFGNPIGLDGVFEASCPPYYPTMDAAVDALFHEPSASRRHQCRIAYQTRSIAPAPFVSAPKGTPAPRRSATTSTTPTAAFLAPSMQCI